MNNKITKTVASLLNRQHKSDNNEIHEDNTIHVGVKQNTNVYALIHLCMKTHNIVKVGDKQNIRGVMYSHMGCVRAICYFAYV